MFRFYEKFLVVEDIDTKVLLEDIPRRYNNTVNNDKKPLYKYLKIPDIPEVLLKGKEVELWKEDGVTILKYPIDVFDNINGEMVNSVGSCDFSIKDINVLKGKLEFIEKIEY